LLRHGFGAYRRRFAEGPGDETAVKIQSQMTSATPQGARRLLTRAGISTGEFPRDLEIGGEDLPAFPS
jgi:hypothetical protein